MMIPARKHRLGFLLFTGTLLYFFANIQRVAIPGTVFNLLQSELRVSAPYITGLSSAFMYVYALNQLLTGLLADRYGGRRVIAFGGLLFCAGSILFPLSHSLGLLYASRILTGLGASTLYLSLVKETMRTYTGNYNIVLSVIIMIGYAGGIVANAPFAAGAALIGFRELLLIAGGLSVLFYVLFMLTERTLKPVPVQRIPISFSNFLDVLKIRHNVDLFLFSGINFGLFYVLQTVIGKKFLEDFCTMKSDSAAWVLSAMGTISAFSSVLFAVLSRATGNRRRIFCRISGSVCVTVFPLLALLVLFDVRSPMLAVPFCFLALTASMSSITIPMLGETNFPERTGAAVSFMNFSFYLAVAVFGNTVGFLMNVRQPEIREGVFVYGRISYLAVFGFLALFSFIVAFFAFRMRETGFSVTRCPSKSTCRE